MESIIITVDEYQFKIEINRKTIRRVTNRLLPNFHFDEILNNNEPGCQYWNELGRYPYQKALVKFKKLSTFI